MWSERHPVSIRAIHFFMPDLECQLYELLLPAVCYHLLAFLMGLFPGCVYYCFNFIGPYVPTPHNFSLPYFSGFSFTPDET